MPTVTYGDFEWDAKKDAINQRDRNLGFMEVTTIFNKGVLEVHTKSKADEIRYKAIGIFQEIEVVVIYTQRGKKKRIISARRAKRKERKAYHFYFADTNDGGST